MGLNGRSKHDGLRVEIVHWDKSNIVFECLIETTKTVIRVPIDNLFMIDEDDDGQVLEVIDGKEAIPLISTETIRVIGDQRYKQTASGAWRMVNSFGEFFMKLQRTRLHPSIHVEGHPTPKQGHTETCPGTNEQNSDGQH